MLTSLVNVDRENCSLVKGRLQFSQSTAACDFHHALKTIKIKWLVKINTGFVVNKNDIKAWLAYFDICIYFLLSNIHSSFQNND